MSDEMVQVGMSSPSATTPSPSLVDEPANRPTSRERDPLPTREQIEAITDVAALRAMLDEVDARARRIEVDLEFGDGDDDWHRRARGALTAHQICLGHLSRHLARVDRPDRPKPAHINPDVIHAKAAKKDATARRVEADAEARRAKAEQQAAETRQKAVYLIEQTSWLARFHTAAAKHLDEKTFETLCEMATARTVKAMRGAVGVRPEDGSQPRPESDGEAALLRPNPDSTALTPGQSGGEPA